MYLHAYVHGSHAKHEIQRKATWVRLEYSLYGMLKWEILGNFEGIMSLENRLWTGTKFF
jgi:hypothetical protein